MKANHDQRYASKTAILQYALALMTVNGGTTTNEVKAAMRNDNYWLRQEEVSIAMNELGDEHNWDIEETGVYRIYHLPGYLAQKKLGAFPAALFVPVAIQALHSNCPNAQFTASPKRGDWFTFDYGDPQKPELFVTGVKDRNQARYFYAQEFGTPYVNVAANEIA